MVAALAPYFAVPVGGGFALPGKAFREAAPQVPCRTVGKISVVAVGFAGEENMGGVVEIVVPLCGVGSRPQVMGGVAVVFQHQVDVPFLSRPGGYGCGDFIQDIRSGIVVDGVC